MIILLAHDGSILTIDGREYVLTIGRSNCESLTHGHDAPHADGSPGLPYHHHHREHCEFLPQQATLYPLDVPDTREEDFKVYAALHPGGAELSEKTRKHQAKVKAHRRHQANREASGELRS